MLTTEKNNRVLTICSNYYKIINYEYDEDDKFSNKLINFYQDYIFSLDIEKDEIVSFIQTFDTALGEYVSNIKFSKHLKEELKNKSGTYMKDYVQNIINIYRQYKNENYKTVNNTEWI